MSQTSPTILDRLQAQAAFLRRRRLILLLCAVGGLFALPALALGFYDRFFPVREPTALHLFIGLALLAGIGLLFGLGWLWRGRPDARQVALRAEAECPELMDSLVCAAELLARREAELSPLNLALLEQVQADLDVRDLGRLVRRRELPGLAVAAILVVAGAAIFLALRLPLGHKARAHFLIGIGHGEPGLIVTPGDLELAVGDDLQVVADVRRGPRDAVRVHLQTADGPLAYEMFDRGDGRFTFEMYGVESELSYYLSTPTLYSPRYTVKTYRRPQVTALTLQVTPPAYTELPIQTLQELRDITVAEGALVELSVQTDMPCEVELLGPVDDAFEPLTAAPGRRAHRISWTLLDNRRLRLRLRDDAGRTALDSATCRLEMIRDFPPIVRITAPVEESSVHDKDDVVPIAARVSDDYGLSRIRLFLSVNGNGWLERELFALGGTGHILDQMVADVVRLDGIVEYGDILSYYLQAADNRHPEPQIGRSELQFLEIRPPEIPPREVTGGGGAEDAEQLSVADLIIEQKRLIKQSFALRDIQDPDRRNELLDSLIKAADDLHRATDQRFSKIKESVEAKQKTLGPFEKLFNDSVRDMDRAHDLLRKRLAEESVNYQQAVLSHLVKIEIELQKNAIKAKSKEPASEASKQQGQGMADRDPDSRQEQKKAMLAEAIRELTDIIQRQDNLNRQLGRETAGLAAAEREFLSQRQTDILRDTDELNRNLREQVVEAYAASRELSKASADMLQAERRIRQDQALNARGHGEQAKTYLEQARQLLRQLRRELSEQQLAEARQELEELRNQQQDLREQTGGKAQQGRQNITPEEARALADAQDRLEQDYQQWIERLKKLVEEMAGTNPEGAQELTDGMRRAQDQNTAGKMKRSGNALRYRQLEQAEQIQKEVEQALQALSQDLEQVAKNAPATSPEELSQMLAEILEDFDQLKNAGQLSSTEQQKLMEAISERLGNNAGRLRNPELQELARQFLAMGRSPEGAMSPESRRLLARSAAVLERKLLAFAMQRKLNLNRLRDRQAPEEYRKLVEEYFKKLSEPEG